MRKKGGLCKGGNTSRPFPGRRSDDVLEPAGVDALHCGNMSDGGHMAFGSGVASQALADPLQNP